MTTTGPTLPPTPSGLDWWTQILAWSLGKSCGGVGGICLRLASSRGRSGGFCLKSRLPEVGSWGLLIQSG